MYGSLRGNYFKTTFKDGVHNQPFPPTGISVDKSNVHHGSEGRQLFKTVSLSLMKASFASRNFRKKVTL